MLTRKSVASTRFIAAVAAVTLGVGTMCTVSLAQQAQNNDPQPAAQKDPSAQPDKQKTNDPASDSQMQVREAEQEKLKQDLMANYTDAAFVRVASMANADEIAAAQQALQKTHNDDVKTFAQHMVDDHTAAGTELKALADSKNWLVSDYPDVKHKRLMREENGLDPADFDKQYVSGQVKDHQEAVALFQMASDKSTDDQLKAFVNKQLPTFQDHLKMAQDLESKLTAMGSAK
jgi:putative membrane protein